MSVLLQRAFQLAESGHFATVSEIEKQLRAERTFEFGALDGTGLRRQLRNACHQARGIAVPPVRRPEVAKRRSRALIVRS